MVFGSGKVQWQVVDVSGDVGQLELGAGVLARLQRPGLAAGLHAHRKGEQSRLAAEVLGVERGLQLVDSLPGDKWGSKLVVVVP